MFCVFQAGSLRESNRAQLSILMYSSIANNLQKVEMFPFSRPKHKLELRFAGTRFEQMQPLTCFVELVIATICVPYWKCMVHLWTESQITSAPEALSEIRRFAHPEVC